jgi:hypothetical protein
MRIVHALFLSGSWQAGEFGCTLIATSNERISRFAGKKEIPMARTHIIRPVLGRLTMRLAGATIMGALFLAPATPAARAASATRFVSQRYGYSITLPGHSGRWSKQLARGNWLGTSIGGLNAPGFDIFTDGRTSREYLVAALSGTWSLSEWTHIAVGTRADVCGSLQSLPNTTLGGAKARMSTWTCSDGYRIVDATALHAGHGYFFLVISPISLSRTSDIDAFQVARQSFQFLHA